MTVSLTHTSSWVQRGVEVDDDGHARCWQTAGQRIGRFARALSPRERTDLERALATARSAPAVPPPDLPGPRSAAEELFGDGLDVVLRAPAIEPPPGLEALVTMLLHLRNDLLDSPVAAIELAVDGAGARLRHLGPEPVRVRAGTVTVVTTAFGADDDVAGSATQEVDTGGVDGPVPPGWELPLVDDLGLTAPRGGYLTVEVSDLEVDALGNGVLRPTEFGWASEE